MENLAPAGSRAALERAAAAGADAVYLGYAAFSARAGAGNFDQEALADAVRYAHARHIGRAPDWIFAARFRASSME